MSITSDAVALVRIELHRQMCIKCMIVELFANKTDGQRLLNFLEAKGYKSDSVNMPVYERLVVLLKHWETTEINRN